MALEIKPGSGWWYTRWMRDGKRHFAKLEVRVEGTPPCAQYPDGDEDFVASRKVAQTASDVLIAKWSEQARPEDLVQEIHRVRFGHRIGSIAISGLFAAWKKMPRKHRPKDQYINWAEKIIERFVTHTNENFPRVKELAAVDKKVAESFMRHEEERHISPKTFNAELILLRGAFEHLREDAGMLANPFSKILAKDQGTIHRKPFTAEELRAILLAVKDDPLMRPLVFVGVFTAMRRGDACLLKWESVDMKNGYIRVKTSKTGETVEIPILAPLREELSGMRGKPGGYVFPALARMYLHQPDAVNVRLRAVFYRAGFMDENRLEKWKTAHPNAVMVHRGAVHVEREKGLGLRDANVRGFHSFRVTWITIALAAGVPMELVTRVTGHQTVNVVLKHYFRPGRDEFKKAIEGAMPRLLMGSEPRKSSGELLDEVLKTLEGLGAENWAEQRDAAARLVRQAKEAVGGVRQ